MIHSVNDFAEARRQMVAQHIAARGVRDPRVLRAFLDVPREAFLPESLAEFAYEDSPLPIGEGQTISQPYIVALMSEALCLKPTDRVLEVGTGSGYAAAVLGRLAAEVYTVERIANLAETAARRMQRLGLGNVHVLHGDGSLGWPEHAPFDAIIVAAGGPEVPPSLLSQLAMGARLVMPVGSTSRTQRLTRITRTEHGYAREDLTQVRFVPLIGAEGWRAAAESGPGEGARGVMDLVQECAEPLESIEGGKQMLETYPFGL
jgi:protein-L-isoaspartate(D-aspartate) O-methyltransferase